MKISLEYIQNIISEIVDEISNEGVGYVYAKDRKKDPKSIPGEHWRIKFASDNDLKKHGDTEMSPVKEIKISKRVLKEIIRELVNESFPNKLNEIEEVGKPLEKNPQKIAALIMGLKEGEYIWFSKTNRITDSVGYGIKKIVEGDYYIYRGLEKHSEEYEDEDQILDFAKEVSVDPHVNFYFIEPLQDYVKERPRFSQEDDQQPGHYELYGADRPEPQFENKLKQKNPS